MSYSEVCPTAAAAEVELFADDLLYVCVDVLGVNEAENAEDVAVVNVADTAALVTEDEVEVEPMPFAANSDFTRLKYVKSGYPYLQSKKQKILCTH